MKKYLKSKYLILILLVLLVVIFISLLYLNVINLKNENKQENVSNENKGNFEDNIEDNNINIKDNESQIKQEQNNKQEQENVTDKDNNETDIKKPTNENINNQITDENEKTNNDKENSNSNNDIVPTPSETPNNTPIPTLTPTPKPSDENPTVTETPSPVLTPTPTPTKEPSKTAPPVTKTQAEINDEYRKQIQNKYSVNIAYKDEMGNYSMNGYKMPVKQTNDNTIYSYLQKIETALKKYPTNFFQEIKNTRMNLTIYMVESIDIGVAGLTDSSNRSNVILMINTISITSFEITLHHEIMHFIDSYISFNLGSGVIASSMKDVNPDNFTYGNTDSSYVYNYYDSLTANTAYFLSNYSKTNYLEDRAVLFSNLMTNNTKYPYLNKNTPIYNKAVLISNQLRDNFSSVKNSNSVYWEKLIN